QYGRRISKGEAHQRTQETICIDILSNGLDMTDRDSKSINDEVNIAFDDVLAEPDSLHGFDCAWRLSYVTFSRVKSLTYGLLASIIAVPASIFWGLIFALLTVVHVWILTPSLKVLDLGFSVVKR
ncbi:Caveolin, partial [Caligus rogercresseyi]